MPIQARLISRALAVTFALIAQPAWSQNSPSGVLLSIASIQENLLITADLPNALIAKESENLNARTKEITRALQNPAVLTIPPEAGCQLNGFDVIPLSAADGSDIGISAGWEFVCNRPLSGLSIGIGLFSLLEIASIDAFVFPDEQQVLLRDRPVLVLP
jgi:hypothetical protein